MQRTDSLEKTLILGKIEGGRRRGPTEDEMVGWHHRLNGRGFGWTPGVGDGQGGLACCSSWGRKDRFVIAFLPRSKRLLISSLELLCAVILEPKKTKSVTVSFTLIALYMLKKSCISFNFIIVYFCVIPFIHLLNF